MRALLSLGLLALLPACAPYTAPYGGGSHGGGTYGGGGYEGVYDGSPLHARIVDVRGDILVRTSRPAYVAIFEIVPGQGVGLLYPAYRDEGNYFPGGTQRLWINRSRHYYDYFAPASYAGYRDESMPRYLYLIASDAPLRLSRFVGSPGALRRTLGISRFAAFNPYSLMEDLDRMVVPHVGEDEWTSHVFVIWPEPRSYYRDGLADSDWIRVRCPDGRIIQGPAYYVYGACGTATPPPTAQRPPEKPEGEPGDSVRVPTRKRPEPEEGGTGSTEQPARPTPGRPIIETVPQVERLRPPETERVRPPEVPVERGGGRARPERESPPRVEAPPRRVEPVVERPSPPVERASPPAERTAPRPRVERVSPPAERISAPVERSAPPPRVEPPPARVEPPPAPRVESPPPSIERIPESRPEPQVERISPPAERSAPPAQVESPRVERVPPPAERISAPVEHSAPPPRVESPPPPRVESPPPPRVEAPPRTETRPAEPPAR